MITAEVAALFFATTGAIAHNTANEAKAQASPKGRPHPAPSRKTKTRTRQSPKSQMWSSRRTRRPIQMRCWGISCRRVSRKDLFASCRPLSGPRQIERRIAAQSANMSQIGKVE